MTWNVELSIAIYMTKAVQRYRMEWEHDIPVFKGFEYDTLEWRDIPWKKLEKCVFKLQKRIYRAASRGDVKTVRKLQKTLMRSWSAKCLAVRRVTQDNQGKKTAGVDGIKSLSPVQRLALVKRLKISRKASPLRRVWIPKPGTDEKRGLGIPTTHDRALQALVKLALEPEWEARFEPNSYGFRPGRSCHDAIEAIFKDIRQKPKYVLDADISKCFDKINHEALLRKINTFPTLRQQIKAWLKSGVMDGIELSNTSEGTPQGGVISPLLANIALHGMEYRIQEAFPVRKPRVNGKQIRIPTPSLIRYADDFVIIHEDLTVVQRCQQIIAEWLKDMGLELKPSKTRLTHTLHKYEENVGFNFLGFQVRQHKTGNYRAACDSQGNPLGFKTLITPSKEKQLLHLNKIGRIIDTHKNSPQYTLIERLNPVIKGWANYYSTTVSSKVFSKLDHLTYQKLRAWASHRCAKTNKHDIVNKYWQMSGKDKWRFATKEGAKLIKHSDIPIKGHIKVRGNRSPYDGDWVYWGTRMGKHPEIPTRISKLLKEQQGKCNRCGLIFKLEDLIEIDRITPGKEGGKYTYGNMQLLHKHCHDNKTREDVHKSLVGTKELEEYLDENPF
jgi:RNA-directed DNA polymerase